jgi:hypothetical protein
VIFQKTTTGRIPFICIYRVLVSWHLDKLLISEYADPLRLNFRHCRLGVSLANYSRPLPFSRRAS